MFRITQRDDTSECTICGAISCFLLVGLLIISFPPLNYLEPLKWTILCTKSGRALHSHSHSHSHESHNYRSNTYTSTAHVATPTFNLILGSMVGFNLLYPHHFTNIYNCPTINYDASASFYVAQKSSDSLYNDTSSCTNTFTVPKKNILIIYPPNESISISACGQHFLLDNNFKNYAKVKMN